jgi:hypothetical protein
VVLCAVSGSWDAVWLLVASAVVLAVALVFENQRIERPSPTPTAAA